MDLIKEFYEENKEWLTPLISSLIGAAVGQPTSTRPKKASKPTDGSTN